ncbi:MAG: hypothetical protein ACTSQU_00085 [Promethearchaeota archaeon]
MNEVEKKTRLKGIAKVVAKEIEVLNTIEQFKEDYKDSLYLKKLSAGMVLWKQKPMSLQTSWEGVIFQWDLLFGKSSLLGSK